MIAGLHISVAQVNPSVGDLDYNLELVLEAWKNVPSNSDLIVFPELVLSGYPPEDLLLKPGFITEVRKRLDILVAESATLRGAAVVGVPLYKEGKLYNAALTIAGGHIIGETLKHHLPDYGVFDEERVFCSAALPDIVEYGGHKLGIMVCEDMWFADVSAQFLEQGAEILIVANGSPFEVTKAEQRMAHAKARVEESGLPLLYVNQVGGQDELVFDGASFALDADGAVVYQAAGFEEVVESVALSLATEARGAPKPHKLSGEPSPSLPSQALGAEEKQQSNDEVVYQALVLGLHDYVRKNGFPGILLGLSGGIDSALAAVIAVDAIGAQNVHCVMMPSRFTSQASLDDAAALAEALGCSYEVISIEEPMAAFEDTIPDLAGVAHENMQSRARGLILMALSNSGGNMVLTTGNKSEMAVGYATLYGDMCGGFNALKDLYKTQVYAISRTKDIIPRRIIERAPSAELRDNQSDQDSLPDYDVLDTILEGLIENEMSVDEIVTAHGYTPDLVRRVWNMLDRAEYKRYQAAPGVKVSSKAFGRDRRYPMTNRFRG